jgi:hypothetical protein
MPKASLLQGWEVTRVERLRERHAMRDRRIARRISLGSRDFGNTVCGDRRIARRISLGSRDFGNTVCGDRRIAGRISLVQG